MPLHLRDKDKVRICQIADVVFKEPIEIWAYGSRVKGGSHDASDLDLVLRGHNLKPIPGRELDLFLSKLQDSQIPIIIQAVDWARIPESFHSEILKNYEVFFCRKAAFD